MPPLIASTIRRVVVAIVVALASLSASAQTNTSGSHTYSGTLTLHGSGEIGSGVLFLTPDITQPGDTIGGIAINWEIDPINGFWLMPTSDVDFIGLSKSGSATLDLTATPNFDVTLLSNSTFVLNHSLWVITYSSDLVLTWTAVPEPSTYAAVAGLLAFGLVAWRRRQTSVE